MAHSIEGDWRIVEMELWDQGDIDLLGPAYIIFDPKKKSGRFRFIAVDGEMDCRFSERDEMPVVEFSWEGNDELDPASGRGWAVLEGGALKGRIFFHQGDDSGFTAIPMRREAE